MMAAEQLSHHHLLSQLLEGMALLLPGQDRPVTGMTLDSRRVGQGDLFLAVAGGSRHGGEFAPQAVAAGAAAVAWEPRAGEPVPATLSAGGRLEVPVVAVERLGQRVGILADRFYDHPSSALAVVGVTGTNGKTTCSHFLAQALSAGGQHCGVVGTLGYGLYGDLHEASHTTPDPVTLQGWLAGFREQGAAAAVMEVSSHGLAQGRAAGVQFATALFTNLSRDHLDYHGDMASYGESKRRLFHWPGLQAAVVNADDAFGREILQGLPADRDVVAYSLEGATPLSDYPATTRWVRGSELSLNGTGLRLNVESPWGLGILRSGVLGRYNAANLLGVLGVLLVRGMAFDEALDRLAAVTTPEGRMERFGGGTQPLVVVDYAHTPDALEQVLTALREHCHGRLWCVFGAGGDRDRGKRPLMGEVAERLADRLLVTDDNPRSEEPAAITDAILAGLAAPERARVVHDRASAIAQAMAEAAPGDVVLVAGKGHERYQEVAGRRLPFSDRAEVLRRLTPGGTA